VVLRAIFGSPSFISGKTIWIVIESRDDNFMLGTVNALYTREIGARELAALGIRQH